MAADEATGDYKYPALQAKDKETASESELSNQVREAREARQTKNIPTRKPQGQAPSGQQRASPGQLVSLAALLTEALALVSTLPVLGGG